MAGDFYPFDMAFIGTVSHRIINEAAAKMSVAINAWLAAARDAGLQIPKPSSSLITKRRNKAHIWFLSPAGHSLKLHCEGHDGPAVKCAGFTSVYVLVMFSLVMSRLRTLGRTFAEPCLPGLALRQLDRLFFSIFPDPPAAVRIANTAGHFRHAYGLKGKPLLTERFHVSVHGIGDYDGLPRSIVGKAVEAGAAVTATSFDVAFDRVKSFSNGNALVLCGGDGVDALMMFHQSLGMAMRKSGLCVRPNFTPHITLLYDGGLLDEQPIHPIRWTVREFVLVHSLIGSTKHVACGRWQLRTQTRDTP